MAQRPPLGIIPQFIHEEKRIKELSSAISRRLCDGKFVPSNEIPIEWIEEFNELVKKHNKRTQL